MKLILPLDYIARNISFLQSTTQLQKDAYGQLFGLNRGVIGQYIAEKSRPKIETLSAIAKHHDISLDELVNVDLSLQNTADWFKGLTSVAIGKKTINEVSTEVNRKYIKKEDLLQRISILEKQVADLKAKNEQLTAKRSELEELKVVVENTHLRAAKTHDNQENMSLLLEALLEGQERFSEELLVLKRGVEKKEGI